MRFYMDLSFPPGRIALQHHGDPIQFANLFIRELE